jgi:hypothetical protein
MTAEILDLLDFVVSKQSVTSRYRTGSTGGGFGSVPPIDLDAMELRDLLAAAPRQPDFVEEALALIERPALMPLGACPACGTQLFAEFDRVSTECPLCRQHTQVADSWRAARDYADTTWLTPTQLEQESRTWGSPVRAGRVRLWRHRGQISADEHGRYLLADVLAVLDSQAAGAA